MHSVSPSAADESDIELYTQGSCHAFAIALHRRLGFGFLVVLDPDNPYWEDPSDADNAIASVTHVYALDAEGVAWDVLGSRPASTVKGEIMDRHPDVLGYDTDEFGGEHGLSTYVDGMADPHADMGDGEEEEDRDAPEVDRPLHRLSPSDVDEAWDCALRVLDGLPGFDPPASPRP
jgi:hypothetical protein